MLVRPKLAGALSWFPEARFGMFVHFGVYAQLGRGEWVQYRDDIPRARYEKLRETFHPHRFDADQWIDVAEAAGARYLNVTAKHHDGFCLWDSALTDYKITNTPFGRDLLGELIAACQRRGMRIVLYYSQPDWHHPNFVHRRGWFKDLDHPPASDRPDWGKFLAYCHGQVEELCTRYGRIDGIWFDGVQKPERVWQGRALYQRIKQLQPAAVVNERAGYGDFFTPERTLSSDPALAGHLVESCQAVCADAWGHKADPVLYSTPYLIDSLVKMAGVGGNYLLNVGPLPDGSIPAEQAERLAGIGAWLQRHGEAIYGTTGTPEVTGNDGYVFTRRGGTAYLHLLRWPERNEVTLTGLTARPTSARLLLTDQPLRLERLDGGVRLRDLPATPPDPAVNVIVLEVGDRRLVPRPKTAPKPVIEVATQGAALPAEAATLGGFGPKGHLPVYSPADGGMITRWVSEEQQASWRLHSDRPLAVTVSVELACDTFGAGSTFKVKLGGQTVTGTVPDTGGQREFRSIELGRVTVPAGSSRLIMQPHRQTIGYQFANVRGIRLEA